jgi:hypothetical protein
MNFRVTLWMHPFANLGSNSFVVQSFNSLAVKAPDGLRPLITSWWDGLGAVILDTTNFTSTQWFFKLLILLIF